MKKFYNLEQFNSLLVEISDLPFDDDRVEVDTISENQLTIRFNNTEQKTKTDEDGNEREVYQALVIENLKSFDIRQPHDGIHRLESVSLSGPDEYGLVTSHARWFVTLNGPFQGCFSEVVDDVDLEIEFSMRKVLLGAICLGGIVAAGLWLF